MKLGFRVGRASKRTLFAHAASLVDNKTAISAAVAAQLSADPVLAAEVKAMQTTLAVVRAAETLEPSPDFEARLLMESRNVRHAMLEESKSRSGVWMVARGAACAAGLVIVGSVVFATFLQDDSATVSASVVDRSEFVPAALAENDAPSPEAIRKAASDVEMLAAAVRDKSGEAGSPQEQEQLRAVNAMDADIDAAMDALERNPGCARASHVVHSNLQEQAETLRALYVNRSL